MMNAWFDRWRARRHVQRSPYRLHLQELPADLKAYWKRSVGEEFPGTPATDLFFVQAAEGLLTFFEAAIRRAAPCSLPSRAADSVWHAWLRWDADSLTLYQRRQFNGRVAHLKESALGEGALARTLAGCRQLEGIPLVGPRMPRLFGLDRRLRMPTGHGYYQVLKSGDIFYRALDGRGRGTGPLRPHQDLSIWALLAANLISADMVWDIVRAGAYQQQKYMLGDRANWDVDFGGGGDGGGDGGGCGGGCGGGGGD